MERYRAIPEGYMRIGELAKKTGVTVRTLQYYDKEGLLSPSAESDGGFRLYTDKDFVKLIQILMMKQLGFPLSEIKKRLTSLDTPQDVVNVLTQQVTDIRMKMEALAETVDAIEALTKEIEQMQTVDFKRYMAILVNLQMKNQHYWMIKHIDDEMMEKLSHMGKERGEEFMKTLHRLSSQAAEYYKTGVSPESEQGLALAKELWDAMMDMADGNIDLLVKFNDNIRQFGYADSQRDASWDEKMEVADNFMYSALEAYFGEEDEGGAGA